MLRLELVSPLVPRIVTGAVPPPRLESLAGVSIGLLANGKPNSERLLIAIAERLQREHGAVVGHLVTKPHISLPASAHVLDTFAAEVAVVLSAVGD